MNTAVRGSVGVVFRTGENASDLYVFEVTPSGQFHLNNLDRAELTG